MPKLITARRSAEQVETDRHVGERIKARRRLLEISQEGLAAAMRISFQQIAKYEGGANTVSAFRLYELAKALRCQPGFFFEGLAPIDEGAAADDPMRSTRALELVRLLGDIDAVAAEMLLGLLSRLARRDRVTHKNAA